METDLIFHHGVDLAHFAAFPLLAEQSGRTLLADYYDGYAHIARDAGVGLLLESPTWRANPDWGYLLGYDDDALFAINTSAIQFLIELRHHAYEDIDDVLVSGMIGPRGDGYVTTGAIDASDAASYHRSQIEAFAGAGADLVSAYTLTEPGEAIGIVTAARNAGVPVAISFTVETDGRLAGGNTLADTIEAVEQAAAPDYYLVNCAHPLHIERALETTSDWVQRIIGIRANASTATHAELDDATELDEGNPAALADDHDRLRHQLPALKIIGGCCGTDSRHIAHLWKATERVAN